MRHHSESEYNDRQPSLKQNSAITDTAGNIQLWCHLCTATCFACIFSDENLQFIPGPVVASPLVAGLAYTCMCVGRGGHSPLDFENFSKNRLFSRFREGKPNFTNFGPPRILEKSPSGPTGKNFSDAHVCLYVQARIPIRKNVINLKSVFLSHTPICQKLLSRFRWDALNAIQETRG